MLGGVWIVEDGRITKKKKSQESNFWLWITIIFLTCVICKEWDGQQKLAKLQVRLQEIQELKEQAQRQYQLQELNLISTNGLVNNPKIHSFFTNLLTTYAEKFAKSKELDISHLPLVFDGLHSDPQTGNGYGEMGYCSPRQIIYPFKQKEVSISINRLYLLNKLGHDRYFESNPQYGDYSYLDISFDRMIDTCCHELAHYIQLVKHGKSSCESDLKLNNGKYDEELAKEQEEWTGEIYGMIEVEIGEWEKRWKEIE